jgi:HD-like signal output (HDOD) protein
MNLSAQSDHKDILKEEGEDLSKRLKGIIIPPRPTIMEALLPEMRSTNANLSVISKLISKDVGLTTGILRVVNSPFFGLSRKISSVDRAINMLGLTNLTKLVMGILVKQAMTRGDLTQFWENSEGIANITGYLANKYFPDQREDAYTFGLLQNIGVALIMQKYVDYDEIEYQAQINHLSITEVEQDFYDTNHTTLGYILARSWNLSENISQAILRHHDVTVFNEEDSISDTTLNLIAIGNLAESIQNDLTGKRIKVELNSVFSKIMQVIEINQQEYEEIKTNVYNQNFNN